MKKILENLLRLPRTIILIYILISCISLVFTIQNLIINTSTDSLIDERLEFKVNQKELKESFSVLNNNILIRIKTSVSGKAKEIGKKILKDLKKKEGISFFYSPNLDLFFKENFFLFMNETEKQNLVEKLYEYQPFLSELNNNKSKLSGFNNLLELSLKENSDNSLEKFKNIFENFTVTLNTKTDLDWSNVLSTGNDECFIILGLKKDYLNVHGFDDFYRFLLKLKKFESPNLNIDFTGGLIIDYEEISSVSSGALYSGLLSFFLVGIILWVAFKNFLVIVSLLFTIVLGLLITLGLTTALIGSLNLISVAFAVLFIGLSVDYGIQVCSRIVEYSTHTLIGSPTA